MKRKASCCCGQLSITVEGDPIMVASCSCTQCQKRTGSAFGVSSYFKDDQVLEKVGEGTLAKRLSDSGSTAEGIFCPACGSTVYGAAGFMPGHTFIAVGCFADPDFPEPQYSAWNATKHKWVEFPETWLSSETQDFGK